MPDIRPPQSRCSSCVSRTVRKNRNYSPLTDGRWREGPRTTAFGRGRNREGVPGPPPVDGSL